MADNDNNNNNEANNHGQEDKGNKQEPEPEIKPVAPGLGQTEEDNFDFEQQLLTVKEVFVYRVPPLRTASGYRAEEWDLANPLFTGVLRVYQRDNELFLRLYEPKRHQVDVLVLGLAQMDLELFAECPIRLDEGKGKTLSTFIETVVDSSRYFVVRCEDRETKRHAFIGMGFRERQFAFDLKAVLQDFVKYVDRARLAEEHQRRRSEGAVHHAGEDSSDPENQGDLTPVEPEQDLSIKDGEKIKLSFAWDHHHKTPPRERKRSTGDSGALPLLAPPPAHQLPPCSAELTPGGPPSAVSLSSEGRGSGGGEEEDWGDFTAATP